MFTFQVTNQLYMNFNKVQQLFLYILWIYTHTHTHVLYIVYSVTVFVIRNGHSDPSIKNLDEPVFIFT